MAQLSSVLGAVAGVPPTRTGRSRTAFGAAWAAALLGASGVVHLALVPPHIGTWVWEGTAFAVAGWLQVTLAVLLVTRPSRVALLSAAAIDLVLIALWVVSRTSGLPFGPDRGRAVPVGFIDAATVAMEAAAVVVALALAVRSRSVARTRPSSAVMAITGLALAGLTSAMLLSPSARDHTADVSHDVAATADPAPVVTAAAPAASAPGSPAASATAAAAEPSAVQAPVTTAHVHEPAAAPAVDDKGLSLIMNGHQHEHVVEPMDSATTALLAHQLARTAELVALYPTVADAEAAGYRRQGPYSPGLGTHYGKGGATIVGASITDDNVLDPMLIFDGSDPTSKIAGFMYIAVGVPGIPDGFAGPNDTWHFHTNVCLVVNPDGSTDAPLGADRDNVPKELCDQYGGFLVDNTGYMLHVWTVPGYESSKGVFNEVNPALTCADGTYYTKPIEQLGLSHTLCADA